MTATKLDLVKVEDWGLFTDTTKPIIIAGPCSAESEQQVFETAKGLKMCIRDRDGVHNGLF